MLTYTRRCLEALDPLAPLPTGEQARIKALPDLEVVLFDVYGTLLVSSSGDVDITHFSDAKVLACLKECALEPVNSDGQHLAGQVISRFKGTIEEMHERDRGSGVAHPEIDVVEVWRKVVQELEIADLLRPVGDVDFERLALGFEMTNNPVYPMPGMNETIQLMQSRGLSLGLVSNAQFFTPILLNYFVSGDVNRDAFVAPFRRELTVMSYQQRRAKPDPLLFEIAARHTCDRGIRRDQVLFVGNDMWKDVCGAHQVGFRTALFAGDTRSLRWRRDRPDTRGVEPDCVITELGQLAEIVRSED